MSKNRKSGNFFGTSRNKGVCPGTFAPALVPGQRDNGTRFFFVPGQSENRTSCPGLSRDVPRDVPSRNTLLWIIQLGPAKAQEWVMSVKTKQKQKHIRLPKVNKSVAYTLFVSDLIRMCIYLGNKCIIARVTQLCLHETICLLSPRTSYCFQHWKKNKNLED